MLELGVMLCKPARVAQCWLCHFWQILFKFGQASNFPESGGSMAGSTENRANSAQLKLDLGLSLAIT